MIGGVKMKKILSIVISVGRVNGEFNSKIEFKNELKNIKSLSDSDIFKLGFLQGAYSDVIESYVEQINKDVADRINKVNETATGILK